MATRLVLAFFLAVTACTALACSDGLSWPPSGEEPSSKFDDVAAAELRYRWETAAEKPRSGDGATAAIRALLESSSSDESTKVVQIRWVTPTEAMVETEWSHRTDAHNFFGKSIISVVRDAGTGWVIVRRYYYGGYYACG